MEHVADRRPLALLNATQRNATRPPAPPAFFLFVCLCDRLDHRLLLGRRALLLRGGRQLRQARARPGTHPARPGPRRLCDCRCLSFLPPAPPPLRPLVAPRSADVRVFRTRFLSLTSPLSSPPTDARNRRPSLRPVLCACRCFPATPRHARAPVRACSRAPVLPPVLPCSRARAEQLGPGRGPHSPDAAQARQAAQPQRLRARRPVRATAATQRKRNATHTRQRERGNAQRAAAAAQVPRSAAQLRPVGRRFLRVIALHCVFIRRLLSVFFVFSVRLPRRLPLLLFSLCPSHTHTRPRTLVFGFVRAWLGLVCSALLMRAQQIKPAYVFAIIFLRNDVL